MRSKKINILLADDHKMVREGFKTLLKTYDNIKVVGEASDGEEALKLAKELKPNLILMDINMPHLNGIEASKKIKEFSANIKIIILTMLDNVKFIMDAVQTGIDGYLYKEAEFTELIDAIEEVSSGNEYFNKDVTEKIISFLSGKNRNISSSEINEVPLTAREIEVISYISKGYTSKAAAEKLFISELTVVKHRKNIIKKLGFNNFTEVITYAVKNNLI